MGINRCGAGLSSTSPIRLSLTVDVLREGHPYLESGKGVSMLRQYFHEIFLITFLIRWHTMTKRQMGSSEKQAFQLDLIVHLYSTAHFRSGGVRMHLYGDVWAVDEGVNVRDNDDDHVVCCVWGQQVVYCLCVGKQKGLLFLQFRRCWELKVQPREKGTSPRLVHEKVD